jgi:predicted nuclease of restriction endonuclease-like RecB superfamily
LVPEALLAVSCRDGTVVPQFLGAHDHPWLRTVLDEHARFRGRPRRELDERLREALPCAAPAAKLRLAVHVLRRLWPSERPCGLPPRLVRAAVFSEASRSRHEPTAVLERVALRQGLSPTALRAGLFADLPGEQLLDAPPRSLDASTLAVRVNLALAQGLVLRASHVRLTASDGVRRVVRLAKLHGLICTAEPRGGAGPLDLGTVRALPLDARLRTGAREPPAGARVASAVSARRGLRARAAAARAPARVGSSDLHGRRARRFDSRVEERFARDVARLAPGWSVLREPEAVPAGASLVFPDFALEHRYDGRRWLAEILGFWSPEYVARKLAGLNAAGITNLVPCVAEGRNCCEEALPPLARVVRYRRWVDAQAVLRAIGDG